mmetsp:Transcript_159326/g.293658  ORF Transcript_159326/g.293658 Transcript_159326/m.293658 type:complete len:91 (+) Transcript_159326:1412-1684(+)
MHHMCIVNIPVCPATFCIAIIAVVVHTLWLKIAAIVKITAGRPTHVSMSKSFFDKIHDGDGEQIEHKHHSTKRDNEMKLGCQRAELDCNA